MAMFRPSQRMPTTMTLGRDREGSCKPRGQRCVHIRLAARAHRTLVRKEETLNDFGLVLPVGTHGVFKQARFYDTKAPEKARTFVIEGGVGREPEPGGRKLTGHWLEDGMKDTIDSYSLEFIFLNGKKIKQI